MSIDLWITFVVASTALLVVPGPTVLLVVSYALGCGKKSGWATVPGVTLGDFTAMTTSLLGAGAVLAASATLFTFFKLAGAIYLIWLGVTMWRAKPKPGNLQNVRGSKSPQGMFWNAYVVTALNPKRHCFLRSLYAAVRGPNRARLAAVRYFGGHISCIGGGERRRLGGAGGANAVAVHAARDIETSKSHGRRISHRCRDCLRRQYGGREYYKRRTPAC